MVRISRIVRAYPASIPRTKLSLRAWHWRWLLPVAALALIAATCSPGGPVIPDFRCPVDGSSYTNDFGPRGSGFHNGIDMRAPTGTPVWAVKSGSVHYTLESAGGLVAYLSAVDGNVYYYAHMSEIIGGGDRGVGKGEPIGRVGQTGNATGPHLHFEIRLGGVNGQRANPYATLRSAGC
jgi:murein DD-endopeptidase MepM/ murein hydrolase activator NlpD